MTSPLRPGDTLAHYRIVAPIGEGGMGVVFRAEDSRLGREVALKVLPPSFAANAERMARFEREARLLARLSHPNIAQVHGLETAEGRLTLVMELAEGRTLAEILAGGPLPLDEALGIARQVAEALEAAHEQGIVHRDLKPQNVMVTSDGKVKVLDFGLAKAFESPASPGSASQLADSPTLTGGGTALGVLLGTAGYMAPEQARGKPVDKRADVWAFGVLLFEMISGRRLFPGETVTDTLAAVLRAEPDWEALPTETPRAVRRVLRLCLTREPRERLHDVADARILLDGVTAATVPGGASVASRGRGWLRRLGWAALGAATVTVVLLATRPDAEPAAAPSTRVTLRRLTELPGPELQPALSPDGDQVVYASAASGNLDLYLLRVGGDRPIPLTRNEADDTQPAFSPDGSRIAFRSEREGGGLFVMGATGESVRRVTDRGFDPSWSPDGSRLVWSTESVKDPLARNAQASLWTVEIASGVVRQLTETDAVQPRWSPDGRTVAYWTNDGGQRDLRTVRVDGGEPVRVTRDDATDWSPAWSPDGRWLYFGSDRAGSMSLWRIAIDPETGGAGGEPEPVTNGTRGIGYPTVSADGSRLAVMAYERTYEHLLYATDPARPRESARLFRTLRHPSARWCRLSPDGSWLACRASGVPEDLLLVDRDGTETRRLTSDPPKDRNPVWDPGGKNLVFMSTRGGAWETWTIRADGSGLRRLREGSVLAGGAFSPDGARFLAAPLSPSETGLTLIDLESGENTHSDRELGFDFRPGENLVVSGWTADGRIAAFVWDASGRTRAYLVFDLDGEGHTELDVPKPALGTTDNVVGGWFPDGRHLVVLTPGHATVVDVDGGETFDIAPAGDDDRLSLSRDGKTLLVERELLDSDIWLLELEER